jgi:hypothetical protein
LLGVRLFEDVPDVIDNAADRQTAHVRTFQKGKHTKFVEHLLNEIAAARICLLDPKTKAAYDHQLRSRLQAVAPQAAPGSAIGRHAAPLPGGSRIGDNATLNRPMAQPLPVAAPLAPVSAESNWDALIGDPPTTPHATSGKPIQRHATPRKSGKNPKFLGAGVALGLAAAVCVAAFALIGPEEASLAFDWPPADRMGATLIVDDQPVTVPAAGPWEYHCPRGTHRIFAKRPAFKLETPATVAAGEHKPIVADWKPKAMLVLNWPVAERSNAALLIDGVSQAVALEQPWPFPVEPGRHVVRVTRGGAEPFEESVPVGNDERQKITVALAAEPTLVIQWPLDQRHDATLSIDDAPVTFDSSAAALSWSLKSGRHTIRISRPGYEPFEQIASLVAGESASVNPVWKRLATTPDPADSNPLANNPAVPVVAGPNPPAVATGTKKLAPPLPAEQDRIAKELDDIYKPTSTAAKDRAMVAEMFKVAGESGSSPAERFMLWKKAAILAAQVGDFETAFQGVDLLDGAYEINGFVAKQKLLAESIKSLTAADQVASLIAAAEMLIKYAVATDQYDAALAIVATAKEAIARRPSDFRLFKEADEQLARHRRDVSVLQTSWTAARDARKTLEKDPANSEANLTLGRWYCLLKNDWPTGLPLLAKGSDAGLTSLAKQELKGNLDVNEQNQLADGWWDRAQKETDLAHDGARLHAGDLYHLVLPNLQSPLKKAAIEQRLVEAATVSSHGGQGVAAPGGSFHHDQWIDLLHLVNPATDGIYGTWTRKGSELVCDPAEFSRIRFPIEVTGSYDLEIEFTRKDGNDEITTMIPVGGQPCMLLLSAFDGKVSGFSRIAGVPVRDQQQYAFRPGKLENGRRYRLLIGVRVLKDNMASIDTWLQGKACWPQWRGPRTDLLMFAGWGMPTPRQIGVGAWKAQITFHSIRLRILSGEATAAAAMTERPPTVRIVGARFGGGSNWSDVTQAALACIRNGEPVWAAVWCLHVDPTPGWRKHLDLNFDNSGKPEAASFDEGAGWKMDPVLSR